MEVIHSTEIIGGKRKITFESGWTVWLNKNLDPGFRFLEGTVIDRSSFERFIMLHQYPRALEQAVSLLAQRARSDLEIEQKLRRAHYDHEVIQLVLYKLNKEKLLNDKDFSFQWVESRKKNIGSARLSMELRRKGIEPETIQNVLSSFSEEEELENAVSLARKKIRAAKDDTDSKKQVQTVTAFLVRRGFSWETAKKAYRIAKGHSDPDK